MKKFFLGLTLLAATAQGDIGGLSAEADTRIDDMLVRRIRDPSNGVVCYMTTQYAFAAAPHGRTVAIACVK